MKKIRTAVIDDDSLFRTIIRGFIENTESLEFVESFSNPIDAINFLNRDMVDLVFLDVEMPEMTGLQFIPALNYRPHIVLVTSDPSYAVSAFEHNVTDYLLKPLDDYARFVKAVNRVTSLTMATSDNGYFFIKENSKLIKINYADISYIEAYGDYVKIYQEDKYYITLSTLKAIFNKLPQDEFLQIHRSYLVRLDKVESIEGNNLNIGNYSIPFSKSLRETILEKIVGQS